MGIKSLGLYHPANKQAQDVTQIWPITELVLLEDKGF